MATIKEEPLEEEDLDQEEEELDGMSSGDGGIVEASSSTIKFIDSSRGKKILLHDGHIFHINSTVKGTTYFKCSQKYKGCTASIIVKKFNKKTGSYQSFAVGNGVHVNHLPNPEKVLKREEKAKLHLGKFQADFNSEAFKNSKHVCLFCLHPLPRGYLKISALENVLPSGQVLTVPLNDAGRNSQAFDLLCCLLNVKWKKCREGINFDQGRCLPLCFKCQNIYQELIQVHQQIRELELQLNRRVKLIRDTVCKTEVENGGNLKEVVMGSLEGTQLALLGLHVFRRKVADPAFKVTMNFGEDTIAPTATPPPRKLEGNSSLKPNNTSINDGDDPPLVKQEVEEVDQALNDLFDDNGDESSWSQQVSGDNSMEAPSLKDFGGESTSEPEEKKPVRPSRTTRNSGKLNEGTLPPDYVEEDDDDLGGEYDGGSDDNYSAAGSPMEEEDDDDDSDSDFEVEEIKTPKRKGRKPRNSLASRYRNMSFPSSSTSHIPSNKPTSYKNNPRRKRSTATNTCHICSARLIGQKAFHAHYASKHPSERRYTCIYCRQHFNSASRAIVHQRNRHTGEKPFSCSTCPASFASEQLLTVHVSQRHSTSITLHPCPKCSKTFPSKTILTNHLTAMHGAAHRETIYKKSKRPAKTLTCHLCAAQIIGAGPFIQHYRELHPEEKRFTCKFCQRHFPYIREVLNHQRTKHTGERPFQCPLCPKSFTNDKGLRSHHLFLHSNAEKTFQCPHCPKRYAHRNLLQIHLFSHKLFVVICKMCGRTFRQQSTFHKHNRLVHDNQSECTAPVTDPTKETLQKLGVDGVIQCRRKCHVCMAPIPGSKVYLIKHFQECHPDHPGDHLTCRCGQRFDVYKKVFSHAIRKHPGAERAHQCDQCPLRFLTTTELRNHARSHIPVEERQKDNICDVCGLGLATPYALVAHMKRHDEGNKTRHVCELCGKSYAEQKGLQQHRKTEHLKILPHKCSYCDKSFPLRSILLKHQNIHTGEKSYRCEVCGKNFHYSGSLSRHLREVHNARGEKGQTPRKKKTKGGGKLNGGEEEEISVPSQGYSGGPPINFMVPPAQYHPPSDNHHRGDVGGGNIN